MYNHYIPQSDGSYRRSTIPEQNRRQQHPQSRHNQQPHREPPQQRPKPEPEPQKECRPEPKPLPCPQEPPECRHQSEGILGFLKGLLPREIDTADLMIIFLLLLMNKDEGEDGLSPILTLALYFLL